MLARSIAVIVRTQALWYVTEHARIATMSRAEHLEQSPREQAKSSQSACYLGADVDPEFRLSGSQMLGRLFELSVR